MNSSGDRFRRGGSAVPLLLLLAVSCTTEDPPPPCPRDAAAFRIELTAQMGTLPEDTSITVRYAGSLEESFALTRPSAGNNDVCCVASREVSSVLPHVDCEALASADGGSFSTLEGGPPVAVYCELWTNGIAEVLIEGEGYPELVETLEAVGREDGCGLETRSIRLVLHYGDGGV